MNSPNHQNQTGTATTVALPRTPGRKRARKREEIAGAIRDIAAALGSGERLPSVAQLERRFGVATATVESALAILRQEGIIQSRPGSGNYVTAVPGGSSNVPRGSARVAPRTKTLAVFATNATAFYKACIDQLVALAAQEDTAIECRFADTRLTAEDITRFEALHPSAFIIVGPELEWIAAIARERGHPVVVIGEPFADHVPVVPTVYADAEQGGYLATRHLLEQGHRRIIYAMRFPRQDFLRKLRWRGHVRAMNEAGIIVEPDRDLIGANVIDEWRADTEAVRQFFARPDAPTGVVAWSDPSAIMVLGALHRAGLRVPADVSVMGYDNLPVSEDAWPPLDSVDQHLEVLARQALLQVSLPPDARRTVITTSHIVPTVIRRDSTAPPRDYIVKP
jgi:DNA-binding LacI/PurR family transcriptional regulator